MSTPITMQATTPPANASINGRLRVRPGGEAGDGAMGGGGCGAAISSREIVGVETLVTVTPSAVESELTVADEIEEDAADAADAVGATTLTST